MKDIEYDYSKNEIKKVINNFEIEINNYSKNEVEEIVDKFIKIMEEKK